jgi:PAS domain S-box-containing protein
MASSAVDILLIAPEDRARKIGPLFETRSGSLSLHCFEDMTAGKVPIAEGRGDVVLLDLQLLGRFGSLDGLRRCCRAPWIGLDDGRAVDFNQPAKALDALLGWEGLNKQVLSRSIALAFATAARRREKDTSDPHSDRQALQARILEHLSDWVTATDLDGRITYVSPSVRDLLGYEPEELIGRRIDQAYRRAEVAISPTVEDYLGRTGHLAGEVAFLARDGREVIVSLHTTAIQDDRGQITGLISVAHDITARKQAEMSLERAKAKLRRKNARLAELTETAHRFVDNVAHEFRTPLTVIQEFASILADGIGGPVSDAQAEYLQIVTTAARDLGSMVNDLLDTSRIKAGTLRVDRRALPVRQIVDPVAGLLQARAGEKQIGIEIALGDRLEPVLADAEKAGRVLVNLVVNAVKFSPEGSTIHISASARQDGTALEVRDEGPGLSPEKQEWIFQRFRQAGQGAAAGSDKGFGLGLNIARELAWLNLGRLDVRSQPETGSTFSLLLVPARPREILQAYVRTVEGLQTRAVAALAVGTDDPLHTAESVRNQLINHCRPMDLALPGGDGRVLLLGLAEDAAAWANRLGQRLNEDESAPGAGAGFAIEPVGLFAGPDRGEALVDALAERIALPAEVTE